MGKTIILEGRYDLATSKVVRDVMTVIKKTVDYPVGDAVHIHLPHDLEGTDEYEMEKANISFSVEVLVMRTEEVTSYRVESFKINEEDVMEFKIYINPKEEPKVYSEIYMKLQEDGRHEMEHILQDWGRGGRPSPDGVDKTGETTEQHHSRLEEVPAMVQGFYRRAKLEGRPLDEIMTDDLDNEIEQGNLTKKEAEGLLRIWMLYSKRRLPKAIYTNQ